MVAADILKGFTEALSGFGTQSIDKRKESEEKERQARSQCLANGGTWDSANKVCTMPPAPKETKAKEPPKVDPTSPETFTDPKTGRASGITLPGGETFLGLGPEDVSKVAQGEQERVARPEGTAPVGTAQAQSDVQFRSQQLAQGVGQFDPLAIDPTGLNVEEALTTGLVQGIPRTLATLGAAAVAGAAIGGATGTAAAPGIGTAIGAGVGIAAGISASMIGNFRSQRSDTTTAQQRVLDEGKQTLKDWATLSKTDPANKEKYLSEFNKQSALINQAYRQMKLDTSRDVAKFETALPNLAEFEAYYSAGGERDALNIEMRTALLTPSSIDYDALELSFRRKK